MGVTVLLHYFDGDRPAAPGLLAVCGEPIRNVPAPGAPTGLCPFCVATLASRN